MEVLVYSTSLCVLKTLITTVIRMKERGMQFLTIPPAYYDGIRKGLKDVSYEVKEDLDKI